MNWSEFFAMGGYGLYVWGSYAATAVVLILNVLAARWHAQRVRREIAQMQRLQGSETE
jgi:heme exporter protein D